MFVVVDPNGPVDGAVYQAVLEEIAALRERRRRGLLKDRDAFKAEANRILAKLGPGWHVYETPRPPLEAHEVMRRELTERLGRPVVAPPRPAPPRGDVLSRELIAEAAFLVVSTQLGSPPMLVRELKLTAPLLAYVVAFLQAAKIIGEGQGLDTRPVLYPARMAEWIRDRVRTADIKLPTLPAQAPAHKPVVAVTGPQDAPSPVLLANATRLLVRDQKVNTAGLLRELRISPVTLVLVLAALEQRGVVGPVTPPGGRKVLITRETPDQAAARILNEQVDGA